MVVVVAAGFLSSCSNPSKNAVAPEQPTLSSVVGGRFVSKIELDHGGLMVAPAPKTRPRVSATTAQALFRATDAVNGAYRFAVLGLGLATVSRHVSVSPDVSPATTATAPGTTTTTMSGSGTGTTSSSSATTATTTTTTVTVPGTTTTAIGVGPGSDHATSSTTAPPTSTTLPRYDSRLAWVGIAWGTDCPARPGSPLATRYVAVVIDAGTGRSVIAYTSRSPLACAGPDLPPSISVPAELVSIPWVPLGPTSTSVRITLPTCSTYFGWTEVPGPGASTVQVVARKPFDPSCGSVAASTPTVDEVVPLGTAQAQVQHAKLGPVQALRTLPGG